jgi:hypothetical protein
VGIKMMNKLTATALFDKNSCLIGNKDVIPKCEAIRLLGSEAVEFADRADCLWNRRFYNGIFNQRGIFYCSNIQKCRRTEASNKGERD